MQGALRLAMETGDTPIYISQLYYSQAQQIYKFALNRAIRSDGDQREIVGFIHTSISTGQTMGLPQILDSRYKVILVGPWDMDPLPGEPTPTSSHLIVLHPSYSTAQQRKDDSTTKGPIGFPEQQLEVLKGGMFNEYRDPVGERDPQYRGRWFAGSAPVKNATEFVAIVQVKYDEAFSREDGSPLE